MMHVEFLSFAILTILTQNFLPIAGSLFLSPTQLYVIAQLRHQFQKLSLMIALDFDRIVLNCPARPTLRL